MSSGSLTRFAVRVLDSATQFIPRKAKAAHWITGQRGEEEAYFYLRRNGYVMVARNFRSPRRRGEIDLIGWDDGVLCFIEVKTRSTHDVKPAEAAVDYQKQQDLIGVAREYLRRAPGAPPARFDILSIYLEKSAPSPQITLFKNAFPMS